MARGQLLLTQGAPRRTTARHAACALKTNIATRRSDVSIARWMETARPPHAFVFLAVVFNAEQTPIAAARPRAVGPAARRATPRARATNSAPKMATRESATRARGPVSVATCPPTARPPRAFAMRRRINVCSAPAARTVPGHRHRRAFAISASNARPVPIVLAPRPIAHWGATLPDAASNASRMPIAPQPRRAATAGHAVSAVRARRIRWCEESLVPQSPRRRPREPVRPRAPSRPLTERARKVG